MNWDKEFKSPFKSDVYFFSTRVKTDQRWGTATPITIRDKEFGAVRVRGYGIYAWHIDDPKVCSTPRSAALASCTRSAIWKASSATPSSAA